MLGSMRVGCAMVSALVAAIPALASPNVAVILTDDLGYGDVSAYNIESKIPTPNFDRIANEGIRFTDAHTPDGVCTPTRYGLLTGRYAWRTRLKRGVLRGSSPPLIEPGRLTLATMLKLRGYRTAMVGKWHLGRRWSLIDETGDQTAENVDWSKPAVNGPLQHGFTYSFGIAETAWTFVENGSVLARPTLRFDLTHLPAYLIGPNNNKGTKSPGSRLNACCLGSRKRHWLHRPLRQGRQAVVSLFRSARSSSTGRAEQGLQGPQCGRFVR